MLGLAGCFGEVQIYCRGTVTRSLGGVHLLQKDCDRGFGVVFTYCIRTVTGYFGVVFTYCRRTVTGSLG